MYDYNLISRICWHIILKKVFIYTHVQTIYIKFKFINIIKHNKYNSLNELLKEYKYVIIR